MARARNLKPGFFINENLVELPFETRLLFAGLWTLADREGRLEDRPKKIKMAIFPADDVDVNKSLEELVSAGVIIRYRVGNQGIIQVVNFTKHQNPHVKEAASLYPTPDKHSASTVQATPLTSSLNPSSLNPESPLSSRVNVLPDKTQTHLDEILDGIRTELNVVLLHNEPDWIAVAESSFTNGFTSAQVLETFQLMRKQKWRTGAIKPNAVLDNITNLEKLRVEIQNGKHILDSDKGSEEAADRLRANTKFIN